MILTDACTTGNIFCQLFDTFEEPPPTVAFFFFFVPECTRFLEC